MAELPKVHFTLANQHFERNLIKVTFTKFNFFWDFEWFFFWIQQKSQVCQNSNSRVERKFFKHYIQTELFFLNVPEFEQRKLGFLAKKTDRVDKTHSTCQGEHIQNKISERNLKAFNSRKIEEFGTLAKVWVSEFLLAKTTINAQKKNKLRRKFSQKKKLIF